MSSSGSRVKATDLLTKFFYEGLSRVVPGLVVLALYGHKYVIIVFDEFKNAWIFGLRIIITAWLIGITLETAPCILISLLKRPKWKNMPEFISNAFLPDKKDLTEIERIDYLKYIGEKLMFRGMVLISLFTLIEPPTLLFSLSNWDWTSWHAYLVRIICLAVFSWSYRLKLVENPYK